MITTSTSTTLSPFPSNDFEISSSDNNNNNNNNNNKNKVKKNKCCQGLSKTSWNNKSSNIKGLTLTTVLFLTISITQLIFALSIQSIDLLTDVAVMFVDVACYLAAIYGETISTQDHFIFKRVYALVVSFLSVLILFSLSILFLNDSITKIIKSSSSSSSSSEMTTSVSTQTPSLDNLGQVLLAFGLAGMFIDVLCLAYVFLYPRYRKKYYYQNEQQLVIEEEAGHSAYHDIQNRRAVEQKKEGGEEDEEGEKPNINTLAAYAHIAADFVRSSATVIAAIYILENGKGAELADPIAGAIASVTIIFGSLLGFYEWSRDLCDYHNIVIMSSSCRGADGGLSLGEDGGSGIDLPCTAAAATSKDDNTLYHMDSDDESMNHHII